MASSSSSSSSSSSGLTFSSQAYALAASHAARHPHATVSGFLLGPSDSSSQVVHKVVPLSHHWTELAVTEDNAIALLRAHLTATSSSLAILGVYQAPARIITKKPSASAVRLASKVAQAQAKDSAHLVLLDGAAILSSPTSLQSYLVPASIAASGKDAASLVSSASAAASSAKAVSVAIQSEQTTIKALKGLLRLDGNNAAPWKEVVDFDDHLENSSVDWLTNYKALASISQVTELKA